MAPIAHQVYEKNFPKMPPDRESVFGGRRGGAGGDCCCNSLRAAFGVAFRRLLLLALLTLMKTKHKTLSCDYKGWVVFQLTRSAARITVSKWVRKLIGKPAFLTIADCESEARRIHSSCRSHFQQCIAQPHGLVFCGRLYRFHNGPCLNLVYASAQHDGPSLFLGQFGPPHLFTFCHTISVNRNSNSVLQEVKTKRYGQQASSRKENNGCFHAVRGQQHPSKGALFPKRVR